MIEIICPTCLTLINIDVYRISCNYTCKCKNSVIEIINNLVRYYRIDYANLCLTSFKPTHYIESTYLYLNDNRNDSIHTFLPLILDNNVIQFQKMIDRFNIICTFK